MAEVRFVLMRQVSQYWEASVSFSARTSTYGTKEEWRGAVSWEEVAQSFNFHRITDSCPSTVALNVGCICSIKSSFSVRFSNDLFLATDTWLCDSGSLAIPDNA